MRPQQLQLHAARCSADACPACTPTDPCSGYLPTESSSPNSTDKLHPIAAKAGSCWLRHGETLCKIKQFALINAWQLLLPVGSMFEPIWAISFHSNRCISIFLFTWRMNHVWAAGCIIRPKACGQDNQHLNVKPTQWLRLTLPMAFTGRS